MPNFAQFVALSEDDYESYRPKAEFHCLHSSSRVNTKNPMKNEFIGDWEKNDKTKNTYLLLKVASRDKTIVLAGSGGDYGVKEGDLVELFDDGNKTTGLPGKWHYGGRGRERGSYTMPGRKARVVAIAVGADQITSNFPAGNYIMWVMK